MSGCRARQSRSPVGRDPHEHLLRCDRSPRGSKQLPSKSGALSSVSTSVPWIAPSCCSFDNSPQPGRAGTRSANLRVVPFSRATCDVRRATCNIPMKPSLIALTIVTACACATETRESPAGPASNVQKLTGAHTRAVWVQHDGKDPFAAADNLTLVGFDSEDGRGERVIQSQRASYVKPLLTPRGDRVVFSRRPTRPGGARGVRHQLRRHGAQIRRARVLRCRCGRARQMGVNGSISEPTTSAARRGISRRSRACCSTIRTRASSSGTSRS